MNITLYGSYISLALICSYVESFISMPLLTPGIKLGLANIVVVVVMYLHGAKVSLYISILRVLLVGVLFGNGFSILYSLAGAILSLLAMALAKSRECFSEIGVSLVGALGHNIGQLLVAIIVLNTIHISYYFIVLMISALMTGMIIGILVQKILPRVKQIQKRGV